MNYPATKMNICSKSKMVGKSLMFLRVIKSQSERDVKKSQTLYK